MCTGKGKDCLSEKLEQRQRTVAKKGHRNEDVVKLMFMGPCIIFIVE